MALLAYIDDVDVRKLVLAQIEIKSEINRSLEISVDYRYQIEKISASLDGLNYNEALDLINNNLKIETLESDGAMSCKILANMISSLFPKEQNNDLVL